MLLKLIFVSLLGIAVQGSISPNGKPFYDIATADELFKDFVRDFKRSYDAAEYEKRFEIFVENLKQINELNSKHDTATFGITRFTDATDEEKSRMRGLTRAPDNSEPSADLLDDIGEIPDEFDWREKHVVTSIKDQGTCGSCWAFSTVGLIEGQYALKYKKLVDFSPQQLVDCNTEDHGCGGGNPQHALQNIIDTDGLERDSDYPYVGFGSDGCAFDSNKAFLKVKSYKAYLNMTEDDMAKHLVKYGPLSVAFAVVNDLYSYTGGVYKPTKDCFIVNHAVTLIGYGTDNGTPYWLLKNSWAETWGEKGFFRMLRGADACEISCEITFTEIQ